MKKEKINCPFCGIKLKEFGSAINPRLWICPTHGQWALIKGINSEEYLADMKRENIAIINCKIDSLKRERDRVESA